MEYVYAAMLLHKAGKPIDENSVKKVLESAGVTPDDARVKALVASLQGVDIDKAIEKAATSTVAAAPTAAEEKPKEEKKAEKKEEKVSEEKAAAGLGALFG